ncbi:hypothetical protein N665_2163s0006 [Sinapis alba]|nr:hypothetical protein N665_2163s0006 [Sinapis alba]
MPKKVKLALMAKENSREIILKKRRSGVVKKVKELSILCDTNACFIMFSPKEVEPMVWPSAEAARNLLEDFNALPDFMKKKNETTLESYLKEKTCKVHENLRKTQKENMECKIDQLMVKLSSLPKLDDLDVKEIYSLISSTKEAIMHLRNKVGSVQNIPLRDPPVYPFEEQVKEFRTTTGGSQEKERPRKTYGEVNMASIGSSKEKQSYYLMDEWIFPSLKPPSPQGSTSNGDHNLEMEQTFPPMFSFPGFVGPVSHPYQHHLNINSIPEMSMNTSKQYPYDFMNHEEPSSIHKRNDIDYRQEPPPSASEATPEEGNVGAKSFDMNMD